MSRNSKILNASGDPIPPAPSAQERIGGGTLGGEASPREPNPDHEDLPTSFTDFADFIKVTAMGSADTLYVRTAEVLAVEINAETSRVQLVMKNGGILPIRESAEAIIARLSGDD